MFHLTSPENTRKAKDFLFFKEVSNGNFGQRCVKVNVPIMLINQSQKQPFRDVLQNRRS